MWLGVREYIRLESERMRGTTGIPTCSPFACSPIRSNVQNPRSAYLTSLFLYSWPRAGAGICWDPAQGGCCPTDPISPDPHQELSAKGSWEGWSQIWVYSDQVAIRNRCGLKV